MRHWQSQWHAILGSNIDNACQVEVDEGLYGGRDWPPCWLGEQRGQRERRVREEFCGLLPAGSDLIHGVARDWGAF